MQNLILENTHKIIVRSYWDQKDFDIPGSLVSVSDQTMFLCEIAGQVYLLPSFYVDGERQVRIGALPNSEYRTSQLYPL